LRERATESSGVIDERLATARRQLELQDDFDHVVVNDDRRRAADALAAIVSEALNGAATMVRP
jgi:guanylate kinase